MLKIDALVMLALHRVAENFFGVVAREDVCSFLGSGLGRSFVRMVVDCSATVCCVYFGRAGCDRDAEKGIVINKFDGHLESRPDGLYGQSSARQMYDVPEMRKTLKSNSVGDAGKTESPQVRG
jgi:hypothetical protein